MMRVPILHNLVDSMNLGSKLPPLTTAPSNVQAEETVNAGDAEYLLVPSSEVCHLLRQYKICLPMACCSQLRVGMLTIS